ncbi:MAG: TIGR04372 family glycosyltransferase [Acidobacteriota bacterium]
MDAYGVLLLDIMAAHYLARELGASLYVVRSRNAPNAALYDLSNPEVRVWRHGLRAQFLRIFWAIYEAATVTRWILAVVAALPGRWWRVSHCWWLTMRREAAIGAQRRLEGLRAGPWRDRALAWTRSMAQTKPPRRDKLFASFERLSLRPSIIANEARILRTRYERHVEMWAVDLRYTYARRALSLRLDRGADRRARAQAKAFGLKSSDRLVCVHARDGGFGAMRGIGERYKDNVRSVAFETYIPAIDYLVSQGYIVVRLGDATMAKLERPGVIDLATAQGRKAELELWCVQQSEFLVVSDSGPYYLPWLFNRPSVALNIVGNPTGAYPLRSHDRYITKNVISVENGRRLALGEVLTAEYIAARFDAARYQHEDNAPEDILAAVREMVAIVGGHVAITDAQREYRRLALALVENSASKKGWVGGRMPHLGDGWIGAAFASRYLGEQSPSEAP